MLRISVMVCIHISPLATELLYQLHVIFTSSYFFDVYGKVAWSAQISFSALLHHTQTHSNHANCFWLLSSRALPFTYSLLAHVCLAPELHKHVHFPCKPSKASCEINSLVISQLLAEWQQCLCGLHVLHVFIFIFKVRFEVLTSEASYCRSLEIVVSHFVKSKQLGMLLTSQERNWLFSRLEDVRAISHRSEP